MNCTADTVRIRLSPPWGLTLEGSAAAIAGTPVSRSAVQSARRISTLAGSRGMPSNQATSGVESTPTLLCTLSNALTYEYKIRATGTITARVRLMSTEFLPAELHAELSLALYAYAASRAAGDAARLQDAADAVCRHAKRAGMPPEALVIALKRAYDTVGSAQPKGGEHLRKAYDRLLSGCLHVYFDTQRNSSP